MADLETAIALATQQHAHQVDKAGVAYIQHPLKVMAKVDSVEAKIVAVLHDILEDTPTTAQDLRQLGFAEPIITAIEALTKLEGETRTQAMLRTAQNPLACQVKLADLSENMDLSRLPHITEADERRLAQYRVVNNYLRQAQRYYALLNRWEYPEKYPKAVFQADLAQNYQTVLATVFDLNHELGVWSTGVAHEWWILFEDAAAYFAQCQQSAQTPDLDKALQLILAINDEWMGGTFCDQHSQKWFRAGLILCKDELYQPAIDDLN